MAEERRLIGDDGKLVKATLATGISTEFSAATWYSKQSKIKVF